MRAATPPRYPKRSMSDPEGTFLAGLQSSLFFETPEEMYARAIEQATAAESRRAGSWASASPWWSNTSVASSRWSSIDRGRARGDVDTSRSAAAIDSRRSASAFRPS